MGFRTTVVFNNDHLELLIQDPNIGRRIYQAVTGYGYDHDGSLQQLGEVVEQAHADHTKLIILGKGGSFSADVLANSHWNAPDIEMTLLKEAADRLGYKLTKKPIKKDNG